MSKTFQFKILLAESQPLIWRRFTVTDDYRLDRFHQVLQIVMGWTNSHLHEFRIRDRQIGMLIDDGFDFPEVEDETTIYIKDLALEKGDAFIYSYDFGDGWDHVLHLEEISTEALLNPICMEGKRACPPEDCGGIWGYSDMLEVLKIHLIRNMKVGKNGCQRILIQSISLVMR